MNALRRNLKLRELNVYACRISNVDNNNYYSSLETICALTRRHFITRTRFPKY